jgi:uncharacterized protein YbjT (DUF2867 family)
MPILVTGATGNVGRLVVDHLLARGARVRALTTNPGKAALPPEVEVIRGYLGRPESLRLALAGVERMYLAPLPATAAPVTRMAADAGVTRIVDLSSTECDVEAAGDPANWYFYAVEHAVESVDVSWTHLRAGEFMINTLMWAEQVRTTGRIRAPYAHAVTAPIDLGDIAEVAAVCLLEDGHAGKKYPLIGGEALSRAQMARCIGAAIGRSVPFEEQTRAQARAELLPVMGDAVDWYLDGLADAVDHPHSPATTVANVCGRPATTYAEWAVTHAPEFRPLS